MGLLDKLEQVEIKADSRLPEDDLMFCETQQQAYDESCRALREIRQQWKKAIQAQRDLLGIGQDGSLPYFGSNYRFGITDLNRELEKFHSRFISELTQHFNEKYSVTISTDAIKEHLIDTQLPARYTSLTYANEADLINVALFGMTAKEWRDKNPDARGNIRDAANLVELIVLSNLENLNAEFIKTGLPQAERLKRLHDTAISQLRSIAATASIQRLKIVLTRNEETRHFSDITQLCIIRCAHARNDIGQQKSQARWFRA